MFKGLKWWNSVYRTSIYPRDEWYYMFETLLFQFIIIWINFLRSCTLHISPCKEYLKPSFKCRIYLSSNIFRPLHINFHFMHSRFYDKKCSKPCVLGYQGLSSDSYNLWNSILGDFYTGKTITPIQNYKFQADQFWLKF